MTVFRSPRTLLWRLGLALMALQAVVVLLLGWYALSQFSRFTMNQSINDLHRIAPLLVQRYAAMFDADGKPVDQQQLMQAVAGDASRTGLRITLISPDGDVLADSHQDAAMMENHRTRSEVMAAISGSEGGGIGSATRRSVSTGVQTTYVAAVMPGDNGPRAIVRAAMPLAVMQAEPAQVVRVVATAALILLALTFVVIYLVSRQLSQSVTRLAAAAARFASGDLAHRIERPASAELAQLADALNHMAHQFSDQIDLLRAQRSEQQAIQQSMSNGLIALDLDQRIISVNRAAERLLGLHGQASRGRLLQELLREPELNRFVDEAIATLTHCTSEFQLRSAVGTTVQAVSEPLRNARDVPVGVLIFINDVTQLRRLESIRSDFAANVSHELRTPITNIKGYVETLLEVGVDDREQAQRFLQIINRNTSRLALIIEDLLSLARLEQPDAKTTLEKEEFAILRMIEAALSSLEHETRANTTRICVDVPGSLTINANRQLLEQAVGNLLSNAIRYSAEGTHVTVKAEQTGEAEITISVADQGPGIPAEHLPRIFERFYRVDRARSREMGGTGLGLSIVKHIALVHNGNMEVESVVGRGSTFRIVLPK